MFAYCGNSPILFIDANGYYRVCRTPIINERTPGGGTGGGGSTPKTPPSNQNEEIRDVTGEIDKALEQTIKDVNFKIKMIIFSDSLVVKGAVCAQMMVDFYNNVDHQKPWDIKNPNSWKETIGTDFPGYNVIVLYHGMEMTPEDLGNYTYGYIGAAHGFSLLVLYGGSYYAAGFPTDKSGLDEETKDRKFIRMGYNAYYSS